jgi:hypothetical protein
MNLEALTFAQGAVAKKDFIPSLQFFDISNGRILGFNGNIAMSSPIDVGISCKPKALQFIKAIKTCRDPQVSVWVTKGNRLAIKSGGFTGFVDCIENHDYPDIRPEGETVQLDGTLLETLAVLAPFIAADASRTWARGILFRGQSAYATNNIILIERWLGAKFPVEINIPEDTVYELLRIREEPISLQVSQNSATFHFRGDRWLRTCLYATSWPNLMPILEKECNPTPIPAGMPYALDDLTIFVDDLQRIYFQKNKMSTKPVITDSGAFFEVEGTPEAGCYNLSQLKLLMGVAHSVDWTLFPESPCLFFGDRLRGAMVGMRMEDATT